MQIIEAAVTQYLRRAGSPQPEHSYHHHDNNRHSVLNHGRINMIGGTDFSQIDGSPSNASVNHQGKVHGESFKEALSGLNAMTDLSTIPVDSSSLLQGST